MPYVVSQMCSFQRQFLQSCIFIFKLSALGLKEAPMPYSQEGYHCFTLQVKAVMEKVKTQY
ncbi:UNVERIFIED_CONTAM: hypothetical protein FKN15_051665 [Acipenser sinensis]